MGNLLLLLYSCAGENLHPVDEPASAESEASPVSGSPWPKSSPLVHPVFVPQCDPPLVVHDLLAEVQDGRALMALLEQLSGCKLVRVIVM